MTFRWHGGRWPLARLAMISAAAAGLAGCSSSTADCDPSQAGFFGGIAGGASGCYDQRIKERQDQLAATQSASDALRAEAERNQALASEQETEIASLETQLASLDNNLARLNSRLKALKVEASAKAKANAKAKAEAKATIDSRRLAEVERQAAALNKERSKFTIEKTRPVSYSSDQDRIKAMNLRSQQLWNELDALVGAGPPAELN